MHHSSQLTRAIYSIFRHAHHIGAASWQDNLYGLLSVCSHYASTLCSLKLAVLPRLEPSGYCHDLLKISEIRTLGDLDVDVWDSLITPDYNLLDDIGMLVDKCRQMKTFIGHVNPMDRSSIPSLRSRMALQVSCAPTQYHSNAYHCGDMIPGARSTGVYRQSRCRMPLPFP